MGLIPDRRLFTNVLDQNLKYHQKEICQFHHRYIQLSYDFVAKSDKVDPRSYHLFHEFINVGLLLDSVILVGVGWI